MSDQPVTASLRTTRPGVIPTTTHDVQPDGTVQPPPTGMAAVDAVAQALGIADEAPAAGPVTATPVGAASSALAPRASAPVGNHRIIQVDDEGVSGDWLESDVRFPTLRIVNGSGKLSKEYNQGTVLFGDEILLDAPDLRNPRPNDVFRIVPLELKKQYQEVKEYDGGEGEMPMVVDTLAEVFDLGGTIKFGANGERPTWRECARCVFLVERPVDSKHPGFAIELDGKDYALAVYYASGTAYRKAITNVFNAVRTLLFRPVLNPDGTPRLTAFGVPVKRSYMPAKFWTWRVVKDDGGKFTVFVPSLKLEAATSDAVRNFADEVRSTSASAQP